MKLSKAAIERIQDAIASLDRGIAFIQSEQTIIGRRTSGTSSDVWKDERGLAHFSACKDIGSDLCGIFNAREKLQRLITPVAVEVET